MAAGIKLDGLARIQDRLSSLREYPEVRKAIRYAETEGAKVLRAAAPVRSGATQSGIKVVRSTFNLTIRETANRNGVPYPFILERSERYGHKAWWTTKVRQVIDVVMAEVGRLERDIERGWG